MSLQDNLFSEDVEYDVTAFTRNKARKRALVFPPVNNYRRFIIHRLVQDRFPDLLHTFSIGQGTARRTVVCYKSDVISNPDSKLSVFKCKTSFTTKERDTTDGMGVEGGRSPSTSPDRTQRQVKSVPTVEIYRPPAARRANNGINETQVQMQSTIDSASVKNTRQKRPDRAVYIPRHRRSFEPEKQNPKHMEASCTNHAMLNEDPHTNTNNNLKLQNACCIQSSTNRPEKSSVLCDSKEDYSNFDISHNPKVVDSEFTQDGSKHVVSLDSDKKCVNEVHDNTEHTHGLIEELKDDVPVLLEDNKEDDINMEEKSNKNIVASNLNENNTDLNLLKSSETIETNNLLIETSKCSNMVIMQPKIEDSQLTKECLDSNDIINSENKQVVAATSDVLIISDASTHKESEQSEQVSPISVMSPEKKVKKIKRHKSKPVPPPSPPLKINRDECDWDTLFDDNGDCLDPTLIEELTSTIGEVMIEQPKNDYKPYSKQVEVSSDEFAHVVEIYNFPSEFKTSDLAAIFSQYKNGGFELKWVDDTHCLGVFSSPLIAAEVLASDHPLVKTRPLSEATASSKSKARRSAEFLQPYRNRPETCAALARRLVTGALGVKLATARQEREHEKNVLREAKEKRRLANKQREDVWEGIIPEK